MIYVVARSEAHGHAFLEAHPTFVTEIRVQVGQRSYFQLINDLINQSTLAYACVVHDDVLLCADYPARLAALVEELNCNWPAWGLVGNSGVLPMRVGYSANNVVRYLSDPHGGPNLAGHILPAQSIDGNTMLLNLQSMREKQISLPDFDGFQLYDIILSTEAIAGGLGVYVAPHLACWHGSKGNQFEFDRAKESDAFNQYLRRRVKNREIKTLNGVHNVGDGNTKHVSRTGIDVEMDSLRSANNGRVRKKIAIVTRTQFTREALLSRTLDTVRAFIAASSGSAHFESYVITDTTRSAPDCVARSQLLRVQLKDSRDSRYALVRFAAENIEADYLWFVDDDDWILPNEAERLGLVVNVSPAASIIFVDCQHFQEKPFTTGQIDGVASYRSEKGSFFAARRFLASLSGYNHTPFCGALFDRLTLLAIPPRVYEAVTYYEDYTTTLDALLVQNCFPVVVDKLFVGISLRESGNTVTETDRSRWNKSMSEMVSYLVNCPQSSHMLSLPSHAVNITPYAEVEAQVSILRSLLDDRIKFIESIHQSTSWKLTRPLRVLSKLMQGKLTLREILKQMR